MKVIEQVINYAKKFKEQGFILDYQTERESGLVQVYMDMERRGIVVVSGPVGTIKTIMEALENN